MSALIPSPTLAPPPVPQVAADQFFDLADAVLAKLGRPPLSDGNKEIIEVRDSDLVLQILAGPGAGKTEVLIWRVLFEVMVRGAEPRRLMVTTFTNKAAQELNIRMVERSDAFLKVAREAEVEVSDPRVHDLRIGTIHALADELLNEFDDDHLEQGFEVINDVETHLRLLRCRPYAFKGKNNRQLLKDALENEDLVNLFKAPWDRTGPMSVWRQVEIGLSVINQHVETWTPRCQESEMKNGIETVKNQDGLTVDLIEIQKKWAEVLEGDHCIDYALLQKKFWEAQAGLVEQLDHVFVDEFQDTNPIQYAIHMGWPRHGEVRLTAVGDDDQALYRWRGSDIDCFDKLEEDCAAEGLSFRSEKLEVNFRSTSTIVDFARAFRETTVLASESLEKSVRAPDGKEAGEPVHLLRGNWTEICEAVAEEIDGLGAGRIVEIGNEAPPSVAILMASTSEKHRQAGPRPAVDLRGALEARGLRVYNPRNKAAAQVESPVHTLLGLISYLIDPVEKKPVGKPSKAGVPRRVEVWASHRYPDKAAHARSAPSRFPINEDHIAIQKRMRKHAGGSIDQPAPHLAGLLAFVDDIRDRLLNAPDPEKVRISLGSFVARMLARPEFRASGYTIDLFRQALFTQLLEANVSVTRLNGQKSLENPMRPGYDPSGKVEWPSQYWQMLGAFGQLVSSGGQDDLEVEAFSEDAIPMLTFHQAKGLEFDHVFVAMTGKEPDPRSVLATMLFSGEQPAYDIVDGDPVTDDESVKRKAEADREREIYVAITRARKKLTILDGVDHEFPMMPLNAGLVGVLDDGTNGQAGNLATKEWTA